MSKVNCDRLRLGKKLVMSVDKWAKNSKTLKHTKDPYEAAFRLFERDFYVPMEVAIYDNDNSGFLTPGRIKMFEKELYKYNDRIESGDISMKWFWSGSALGKKDPAVGYTIQELQRVSNSDRKRILESDKKVKAVFESLKVAAGITGFFTKRKYNKALKEYRKLDLDLIKALDKQDNNAIINARQAIKDFTKNSPLKIYDDFIDIIENKMPLAVQEKYDREVRLSQDKSLSKKEREIHIKKVKKYDEGGLIVLKETDYQRFFEKENLNKNVVQAVVEYNNLMNDMYKVLQDGIVKRVDTIINQVKRNRGLNSPEEGKLVELKKELISKMMPKYKEDGYYPHYTRDLNSTYMEGLMPYFEKFEISTDNFINDKILDIDKTIAGISKWVSHHAKSRKKDEKLAYSRNFIDVIKGYVQDVNRFNTTAFMDDVLVRSRNKIHDLHRTKVDGQESNYARNISDTVLDLYNAANGTTQLSESTQSIVRGMLAFEFTSKMGLSLRSAARNSTQRLLDYIHFGKRIWNSAKEELERMSLFGDLEKDVNSSIDTILKDAGLLFEETTPELLESTIKASPSLYKLRTIDKNGNITYNKESLSGKFANTSSKIATFTSGLHRRIENANRRHTFKIAYGQMHKLLRTSTEWQSQEARNLEGLSDTARESKVKQKMKKISERYAKNMVIANHFDYADYAKSKFMRGGPLEIGRFMFQFQHYSMEFLEKNIAIAKETAGDWEAFKQDKDFKWSDAEGLHKSVRMAIAYFMAPAALMALIPVNMGNLIEHDTWERLKQWATLFTGDPEEVKEAFYGKGALLANMGPLVSDAVDFGIAFDLINADLDGIADILVGVNTYTNDTNITDSGRKVKILNTFSQRFYERHFPMIARGNIGMAFQQELGLYPKGKDETVWAKYAPELIELKGAKKSKKLGGMKKLPFDVYNSLKQLERESSRNIT